MRDAEQIEDEEIEKYIRNKRGKVHYLIRDENGNNISKWE